MTREEIVKGLRIHVDQTIDCDNCPAKYTAFCFEMLVEEAISLLEKEADNDSKML